jgi:hypothetical protein
MKLYLVYLLFFHVGGALMPFQGLLLTLQRATEKMKLHLKGSKATQHN